MQENRLAKLESQLTGRQRVLAWMHRRQQLGGFVQMVMRDVETNLASGTPIVIEDLDAAFVFHCVNDCNARVLELSEAHLEKGLLSLCLKRFLSTSTLRPEEWEIKAFRRSLKVFVLKSKLLDRVVRILSDEYFSGMRVLYDDTESLLKRDLEEAQHLCDLFNAEIAPALGVEQITPQEIEEYVQSAASREAVVIAALARAKAEFAFGNRFSACPFIVEAIRLTECPASTAASWVQSDGSRATHIPAGIKDSRVGPLPAGILQPLQSP